MSCSVMSNLLWSHGLKPTRLLYPWISPGNNTGVGSHSFLRGIILIQGSNPGFLHFRQILYHWDHQRSHILKSRDITLPTKVHTVKALVFPVVMDGCESWTIKETKSPINDAFELLCWRRLFSVPWTARRSNQSILKEINLEYSAEGLVLKLKL